MCPLTIARAFHAAARRERLEPKRRNNMACMTFMRGFRRVNSVNSLTYTIASLPRRHFCSAESNDEDQSHKNARDIEENSLPQGRNLELVVSCLRVDRVIASGLGMGRRFVLQ